MRIFCGVFKIPPPPLSHGGCRSEYSGTRLCLLYKLERRGWGDTGLGEGWEDPSESCLCVSCPRVRTDVAFTCLYARRRKKKKRKVVNTFAAHRKSGAQVQSHVLEQSLVKR